MQGSHTVDGMTPEEVAEVQRMHNVMLRAMDRELWQLAQFMVTRLRSQRLADWLRPGGVCLQDGRGQTGSKEAGCVGEKAGPTLSVTLTPWYQALLAEMRTEQNDGCRNRINPRVIKRKMSKWNKKQAEHRRPTPLRKTFAQCVVMKT